MQTTSKRAAAILLGLAIAGFVVGTVAIFASRRSNAAIARNIPLANFPASGGTSAAVCPGVISELLVTSEGRRDVHETIGFHEVGRRRTSIVAAYGQWPVKRMLTFVIDGMQVYGYAGLDTDSGRYLATMGTQSSHVHLHEDRLCFDVSIEVLNGNSNRERWAGQLSFE